jgi:hypothetical protein
LRVKIWWLKELKVFNALRLSIEVLAEVLTAEVLAAEILGEVLADIAADIAVDIVADVADRTELEARVELQHPGELEVLLVAICCWDSLES